jgi:hypothetical protein
MKDRKEEKNSKDEMALWRERLGGWSARSEDGETLR